MVDQTHQEALWRDLQDYVNTRKLPGYAGGAFTPDGRTVQVFWAGEPPLELTTVAARHRARVAMTVTRVTHDKAQFGVLARNLLAAAKRAGIRVTSVGRTADFSGARVAVEGTTTAAERETLRRLGAVEVIDNSGASVRLTRTSDAPAFWGGAVITDRGQGKCSTGWAVSRNGDWVLGMITAQHCGANRNWYTYGDPAGGPGQNGLSVGTSNAGHAGTDSMVLYGQEYNGITYTGPWHSNDGRAFNEATDPALGTYICAEGGMSGESCNARVEEVDTYSNLGAGPGFWARRSDGGAVAGQGDSGGPGISYVGDLVVLRGMIDEGSGLHPADCDHTDNNPWYGWQGRKCFGRVFFVYQGVIHAVHNVTPLLVI